MPERLARAAVIFAASIALGVYAGLIAVALAMPYRVDLRPPFIIASCVVASVSLLRGMLWWAELEEADKPPRVLPAPVVRIERHESPMRNASSIRPSDCPATEAQLYTITVRVLASGAGVTYRDHQDLFSPQASYKKFYDWLLREGYSADDGSGAKLTDAGMRFFESYYLQTHDALPFPSVAVSYRQDDGAGVTHAATQEE